MRILEKPIMKIWDLKSVMEIRYLVVLMTNILVMKDGEVVILEEDKAHYVDSCLLGRALANCAEVMNQCIELDIKAPYFVLSCSTK